MMRKDKNSESRSLLWRSDQWGSTDFQKSKRPLLYGWASAVCEVHKRYPPGRRTGGIIDNTATVCHAPSSLRYMKKVSVSYPWPGKTGRRIVFWKHSGSCPSRHMGRYSVFCKRIILGKKRKGRKVVGMDVRKQTPQIWPMNSYSCSRKRLSCGLGSRAILSGHADVYRIQWGSPEGNSL